jgi:Leucine-rich repeat (LRR) protein
VLTGAFSNPSNSVELDCEFAAHDKKLVNHFFDEITFCEYKSDASGKFSIDANYNGSEIVLVFTRNPVPALKSDVFEKYPNISFMFYNVSTTDIDQQWFQNSQNMRELYFFKNHLSTLKSGRLVNLENLQNLILRVNSIQNIDEKAFDGLKELELLDLRQNNIKLLHPNLFKELKKLKKLELADNPIKTLNVKIFQNLIH